MSPCDSEEMVKLVSDAGKYFNTVLAVGDMPHILRISCVNWLT